MTSLTTSLATLAATLTLAFAGVDAEAGRCNRDGGDWHRPVPTIQPITYPRPAPHIQWRFGMNVQLINTQYGTGLQVTSVNYGGAAQAAGLEPGDVILTSNGRNFNYARSNHSGVRILQNSVSGGGGGLPAPTVTTASATMIAPQPIVQPGLAVLQVLDSRTGYVTNLNVFPRYTGGGFPGLPAPTTTAPAPAAAAPASAF